jgi:four helix bundle protein
VKFEDLEVWKKSARLCSDIYIESVQIGDFGFKDQLTRSGLSIPSNIAEGFERSGSREIANFLNYAKGSAGELRTQIYIGLDIGFINKEIGHNWLARVEEISKMLQGLRKKYLQS